jgi:2-polyprenyl-3-methyl-5-hydroxy-6-metoxy-1,4-benzoquinol methylase
VPTEDLPSNARMLSRLPEDHEGFDVSEERFLKAMALAEEAHFWFRARNRLISGRLAGLGVLPPATVLELGCGGGCVAAHLSREGYRVTGVDGHASLVRRAALRAPEAAFVVHDLSLGVEPLGEGQSDAAALFDVIEHLDHPLLALEDAVRCVRPGGVVVGTVPALMALWSQVDVQAGHRIRYDRASLSALLARVAGASVVELCPFNRLLVPMMWLQRRMVVRHDAPSTTEENLRVPPAAVNQALLAGLRAEAGLSGVLDRCPLPGASLWFALRRAGR